MPEYRISLGRINDATDLITDGAFTAACGVNWTCGTDWTIAAGVATHAPPGLFDSLTQAGVFTLGRRYVVGFDVIAPFNLNAGVFFGDYGSEVIPATAPPFSYSIEHVALRGTSLSVRAAGDITIDNVTCFERIYNTPLTDDPMGLTDSNITIERDRVRNAILRKYTNELTFLGDGWTFILNEFNTTGLCAEIDVLIEQKCEGTDSFTDYFEGRIYMQNVEFNFRDCQAKCVIEDISAAQILKNNENININFDVNSNVFGFKDFFVDPNITINFHDDTGAHPAANPYQNRLVLLVEETFRRIVHIISDVNVEFESTFFSAGTYKDLILFFGLQLRGDVSTVATEQETWSFARLFGVLDAVFNLAISVEEISNVPTIKIEPKVDFLNVAVLLTIPNINNPRFRFDTDFMYQTVEIGYKKSVDVGENTGSTDSFQYEAINQACNDKNLDVVSTLIANSPLIFEMLAGRDSDDDSIRNGAFDDNSEWVVTGNWVIAAGVAQDAAGSGGRVTQYGVTEGDDDWNTIGGGVRYLLTYTVAGRTAGSITPSLGPNNGVTRTTNGTFTEEIESEPTDSVLTFTSNTAFDGNIDDISLIRFIAKRSYDQDYFIVETDGTDTTVGAGNAYNTSIEPADNMLRWVGTLQTSFERIRATDETITKVNTALLRIWEFDAELSQADWDLIVNNDSQIRFSSSQDSVANTDGFIIKLTRENKSGRTTFELLTS